MTRHRPIVRLVAVMAAATLLVGCTQLNRSVHDFNQRVRRTAKSLNPLEKATGTEATTAKTAERRCCPRCGGAMPKGGIQGAFRTVANVFDHIAYLDVIANDLLQGNGVCAWQDTQRFFINSTLGLAGTRDVATGLGFPRREEDFAQTLGVWGVPQGPLVVLPILGPRTLRSFASPATRLVSNPLSLLNKPVIGLVSMGAGIVAGPRDDQYRAPEGLTYEQAKQEFLSRRQALVCNDKSVEPVRRCVRLTAPWGAPRK